MAGIIAYVGLGSNLCHPHMQIEIAISYLNRMLAVKVLACSSTYRSRPLAGLDQPSYCNAVVKLSTSLSAKVLLAKLQEIEVEMGRPKEHVRWGSRIIDLDLLLYGTQVISSRELTVPHLGLTDREFVIYPLAEIEPNLMLPTGQSLNDLKSTCKVRGLEKINEPVVLSGVE